MEIDTFPRTRLVMLIINKPRLPPIHLNRPTAAFEPDSAAPRLVLRLQWACFGGLVGRLGLLMIKSGYLEARTPQTHWLFLNMYEKWYTNVIGVISLRGPPRGPTFFLAPPEKMLKSTVFELEQWFLHQNGPFFHQEFNGKGLWVLGSQFCTKKLKNISKFQNSWNFWIFGSWTQPGAWHMIVPFWSWNLSDTTHVRPHTKFQLVWAINTVFTRGGAQCAPPPHSNV